jgi:arylsulfatase A-like enzyme
MIRIVAFFSCLLSLGTFAQAQQRPNVILIYADDIGFGDLSCYGNKRVKTPNVDRLARNGVRFNRGYTTAATCTPSRFSLMTGEYDWRAPGRQILPGDAPALIRAGRQTMPAVFRAAGYRTAVVGKWHLGMGGASGPEWNGTISPGPNDVGFDESFIMAATGDRVPTVYVQNGRVLNLDPADPIKVDYKQKIGTEPTGAENPELLKMKHSHGHDNTIVNGVGRIGWMTGGKAARWVDEDMAATFTDRAAQFIQANKANPFFLYFATHDIHVPRVPHPRFAGKSGMGPRGDALLEFDWSVGEVFNTLDKLGLTNNTLIVLSSDNGAVVDDGYQDEAVTKLGNHRPNGNLRGGKYSSFEAGTRVPLLTHWPRTIKPGVSEALVSQVDFVASFAALVKQPLNRTDVPDSQDYLNTLLGKDRVGRPFVIQKAHAFSVVDATWKYIEGSNGRKANPYTKIEEGNDSQPQLYNLKTDPGETQNVAPQHPDHLNRLEGYLKELRM